MEAVAALGGIPGLAATGGLIYLKMKSSGRRCAT
jgi:hypothetical protein